jgi:hypothetical protein
MAMDAKNNIIDMREFDVTYYQRVLIDKSIRFVRVMGRFFIRFFFFSKDEKNAIFYYSLCFNLLLVSFQLHYCIVTDYSVAVYSPSDSDLTVRCSNWYTVSVHAGQTQIQLEPSLTGIRGPIKVQSETTVLMWN